VVSDSQQLTEEPSNAEFSAVLEERIGSFVRALVARDDEKYESEFVHLLTRVDELVNRKLRMEGTKTDTRDFLAELIFTRMRRGMHQFMRSEDDITATRAAEWVMGVLFSVTTLSEFSKAFDQSLIRANSGGQDFNFAGRTDFISAEEVLQMLAAGKHLGCLSLEKGDNRLDIYLRNGRVFFLDPHHLARRVMSGDSMSYQEIPEAVIAEAESRRVKDGVPVTLALFGKEVLFDFMRESEPYAFYYRQLDELPGYALEHDQHLGVTALLLEGSKLVDDWHQMLTVFPDPDAALEPKADMFARMGSVPLGVIEVKLLAQINGDTTPRSLVSALGLPLYEIYQILIRLSKAGILSSTGDAEDLQGIDLGCGEGTIQDSIKEAFAALDANDDVGERQSVIDRVFGSGDCRDDGSDDDGSALSALDKVFGDESPTSQPQGKGDIDRELLSFLRTHKHK
jgi:hypothetical protein